MCEINKTKVLEDNIRDFKALVDEHKVTIVDICYAFIHDKEEAEDLAQDVFIQAYESLNKFRGECKLSTWLYRIAVNKALNYKKSSRYKMKVVRIDKGDNLYVASKEALAQEIIEEQELIVLLHEAINHLPERQRTALILNKYEEHSYKEISEIMEISISSVESLLFRAKSYLEKYFSNYQNDIR